MGWPAHPPLVGGGGVSHMASHVRDTWKSMCHNAWKRPMHFGHMACHVSTCMALLKPIYMGFQFSS